MSVYCRDNFYVDRDDLGARAAVEEAMALGHGGCSPYSLVQTCFQMALLFLVRRRPTFSGWWEVLRPTAVSRIKSRYSGPGCDAVHQGVRRPRR
jgi:hypothetical protein